MSDEPLGSPPSKRSPISLQRVAMGVSVLALAAVATFAAARSFDLSGGGTTAQEKQLFASLTRNLPNTKISSVSCASTAAPKGFCEFVAGRNVLYATPDGRYVMIGQLLDLQKKVDMTERRAREVAGVADAEDRIAGRLTQPTPRPQAAAGPLPSGQGPSPVLKVDLPAENAIVHNRGARLKMTVFTDFNCHYCQQLFQDLKSNRDIEITEFPIAVLGPESEAKAKKVLCAQDRVAAAKALYDGGQLQGVSDCADGGRRLQQNLAFAQSHGINGTPMIVRVDGATNPGWMPADKLLAWLNAARS